MFYAPFHTYSCRAEFRAKHMSSISSSLVLYPFLVTLRPITNAMSKKADRMPQFKLVVVGDGGCGKTCMLSVYSEGYFPAQHVPTIFDTTSVSVNVSGKEVQMELWDTAGQEDYDRLRPMSYPDTHVVLLTFSIANPDSLANARAKWIPELNRYCPKVPVILVGAKSDLRTSPDVIQQLEQIKQVPISATYAKQISKELKSVVSYMECSAKNSEGLREIFETAARYGMLYAEKKRSRCRCAIL